MCGIFLHFAKDGIIRKELMNSILDRYHLLEHRGPDRHTLSMTGNCLIGFHRLAINDVSTKGDQPFELRKEFLMCNGEIYNYDQIQRIEKFPLKSKSDCEILLHMFQRYGIKNALEKIDGVFAIVYIVDDTIHMIRDRIGVKPLFYIKSNVSLTIASEPVALDGLEGTIVEMLPSTCISYSKDFKCVIKRNYYTFPNQIVHVEEEPTLYIVRDTLINAIRKRMCSDRPIGCLLSGGLDSSLVASILSKEMESSGIRLKTFSVGFPDSTDLVYARKVAEYLQTDHHELVIQYTDALKYIPTVIQKIGSYDTTSIRASIPMYMLCEWINKNFSEKVIFSGEGSDELFCGYLYSHNAPSDDDLVQDSIRLVEQLYKYDVLRADRCTAGNSLEFREPFLDQDLISVALQMAGHLKKPLTYNDIVYEKYILRKAFIDYLPEEVLWRRKAAFSDAVSSSEKPWYKWIQEYADTQEVTDFQGTQEGNYYKTIFINYYKTYMPLIPLWLPKWSDTGNEPSATMCSFQSFIKYISDFCYEEEVIDEKRNIEFVPTVKIDMIRNEIPEIKIDMNLEDLDLVLIEPEQETSQVLDSPITYHTTYIS